MDKDTIDRNTIPVSPVEKYAQPEYPSLSDANDKPDLLQKLPSRWQSNDKVVAAAGLLNTKANISNTLNVAPIFIHGDGTGAAGCVMVVPSVFLSEQEALAIIKSVAESEGISFNTLPPEYIATKNDDGDYLLGEGKVRLRYYDSEKQVAVAYIPMRSAKKIRKNRGVLSVSSYNARRLAEMTAEDLSKQEGNIAVGVFYEPGIDRQNEEMKLIYLSLRDVSRYDRVIIDEYKAKEKEIMEKNLREQVHDFIKWLQRQGIIQ
jgi:hypothetical protein